MPTDREQVLTPDPIAAGTPIAVGAGDAAPAEAAPLAPPLPAPSLLERCQSESAALERVNVLNRDRKKFLQELRLAMAGQTPCAAGPGALLALTGLAQSGKTTILEATLGLLPEPAPKGSWTLTCPVIMLTLSADLDLKTLIWLIISALDPQFGMATVAAKIDPQRDGKRMKELLREFETKWLVLDGAEELDVDVDDDGEREKLFSFLGDLRGSGDQPINIILSGREPLAELVLLTAKLATGAVYCSTDVYDNAHEPELVNFVEQFLDQSSLPQKPTGPELEALRERLFELTQGNRAAIRSLVMRATVLAITSGAASLTTRVLDRAYSSPDTHRRSSRKSSASMTSASPRPNRRQRKAVKKRG